MCDLCPSFICTSSSSGTELRRAGLPVSPASPNLLFVCVKALLAEIKIGLHMQFWVAVGRRVAQGRLEDFMCMPVSAHDTPCAEVEQTFFSITIQCGHCKPKPHWHSNFGLLFACSRSHTRKTSTPWPQETNRHWQHKSGWRELTKVSTCWAAQLSSSPGLG